MCLFTSALRASVNKSHIPSLPQNNLYVSQGGSVQQFTSLPEELNSRFRIPRTQNSCALNNASVYK
jgi:hypothetical protein